MARAIYAYKIFRIEYHDLLGVGGTFQNGNGHDYTVITLYGGRVYSRNRWRVRSGVDIIKYCNNCPNMIFYKSYSLPGWRMWRQMRRIKRFLFSADTSIKRSGYVFFRLTVSVCCASLRADPQPCKTEKPIAICHVQFKNTWYNNNCEPIENNSVKFPLIKLTIRWFS